MTSSYAKHELAFTSRSQSRTASGSQSTSDKRHHHHSNNNGKHKQKIMYYRGAQGPQGPAGPAGSSIQGPQGEPGINGGIGPTGAPGQSINDSSIYLMTVLSTSFPNSFDADSSSSIISFVPIIETNSEKIIGDVLVTVTNASKTFNFKPNNQTGYKVKTLRVTCLNLTATGSTDVTITLNSSATLGLIFYLSIVWDNN